jgi:Tol biopolymer transport system component
MIRLEGWLLLVGLAGCGSVSDSPDAAPTEGVPDAALATDAPTGSPDAAPRLCRHDEPFVSFGPVPGVNTTGEEQNAWLSHDELTLVLSRAQSSTGGDLFVAHRAHLGDDFSAAVAIDELDSGSDEYRPSLSDDGLTIYFDRRDITLAYTLMTAVRETPDGVFGEPAVLAVVNGTGSDFEPFVTGDGMYFASTRAGLPDLYFAPRAGAGFGTPVALTDVNSEVADEVPVASADGRALYFSAADRGLTGGTTKGHGTDVWIATRSAPGATFGSPAPVTELATSDGEYPTWLSDDNCRLYYVTTRSGTHDLWVASR